MFTFKEKFIGLDLETTGSDYKTCRIIQLGIAIQSPDKGIRMIRLDTRPEGEMGWDYLVEEEASQIHKFTKERILNGLAPKQVDALAVDWLEQECGQKGLIPMGFNVAGFDMPFVRRELPLTAARLSYRTIDFNAPLFLIAETLGKNYDNFKRKMVKEARLLMQSDPVVQGLEEHDAGFDAVEALYVYQLLINYLRSDTMLHAVLDQRLQFDKFEE